MSNDGRFKKGQTPHNKIEDIDHGDWQMYNRGCKCDLCKAAVTAYQAELNGRIPLSIQKTMPCVECGIGERYRGKICRDCHNERSRIRVNAKNRPTDYWEIHESQDGVCAICRKPETALNKTGKVKELAADHNHETGEWRGLLCARCNTALGLFGDDIDTLMAAINYLRGWT